MSLQTSMTQMSTYEDVLKRLKVVIHSAVDGIIIINDHGEIEEVNPSACILFGYTAEEMLKKNLTMLIPDSYLKPHQDFIRDYLKTRIPKIIGTGREVKGRYKDGTEFPFWLAVSEVKLLERTIFVGFIHDLSEVKTAEYRLKILNKELEKKVVERTYELEAVINQLLAVNKKLEEEINKNITIQNQLKEREIELEQGLVKERELGELKSRFVSMASHEFRTPLATILSSVSLIGRYTETDQQENREKHINKIKSSVTHLTDILNDFLSMNKLEEGKIISHQEMFDVVGLWKEVKEEMTSILKQGQSIHSVINMAQPIIISDRKIIKNILFNLISNAIKYSADNGIIECSIQGDQSRVIMTIKDNGIGIPPDEQKHLFERFFRASNVTNIEGTGLGLNIVKKYVEMLGGQINFSSKLYSGTTFTVEFGVKTEPAHLQV